MDEQYNNWNKVKKDLAKEKISVGFKNRDIFYVHIAGVSGRLAVFDSEGLIK